MKHKSVLAWHFVGDKLRDGRPIPPNGETLIHNGRLGFCVSGLHASRKILDALQYAPGNTICRVRCADYSEDTDKLVSRKRTILWRIDGKIVLRGFARRQALSVAHLWDMPVVVREYLETGEESKRDAAWAAAWAARDAACDAARDAANKLLTKMVMEARKS